MTGSIVLSSLQGSLSRPIALRSCFSTNCEVITRNLKADMSGGLGGMNGVAEDSCLARS